MEMLRFPPRVMSTSFPDSDPRLTWADSTRMHSYEAPWYATIALWQGQQDWMVE